MNSDHAIQILMTSSFDWSKDWYFWGQNRLGSLMPLLGSCLYLLPISAIDAIGVAHILVVLSCVGMLFFLLDRKAAVVLATITLLFPIYPFWMQISLGHPYLPQVFFAFSLLVVAKCKKINVLSSILVGLVPFLGLWSTEIFAAFLLAFGLFNVNYIWSLFKAKYITLGISALGGIMFFRYAKKTATQVESYGQLFATRQGVAESLTKYINELMSLVTFNSNKPFNVLVFYGILLSVVVLLFIFFRSRTAPSKVTLAFLGTAVLSLFLIQFSHWNYLMGIPFRYATAPFIFFALSIASGFNDLSDHDNSKYIRLSSVALLSFFFVFASLNFVIRYETGTPDRIRRSSVSIFEERFSELINSEKQIGLVGSYWNTYLVEALTDGIISFPRKGEHIRTYRNFEVWKSMNYYVLVSNEWLEVFPDSLEQHGVLMRKVGIPESIGQIDYCLYERIEN